MVKLYPPEIQGTLPAFTGATIVVPFNMNKAVSLNEVSAFQLKIKTAQNDKFICTVNSNENIPEGETQQYDTHSVTFHLSEEQIEQLTIGISYKLQLAYIDRTGVVGYFSTVGVAKFTTKPVLSISGLSGVSTNAALYEYVGVYNQRSTDTVKRDATEKVYSYQFQLFDENEEVIEDTGVLIHNAQNDVYGYESHDIFRPVTNIEEGKTYYIKYYVTTRNKLEVQTPIYRLMAINTIEPECKPYLHVESNNDEGYIRLWMDDEINRVDGLPKVAHGIFEVSRKKDDEGWIPVTMFTLQGTKPSEWEFKDFVIEHGCSYQYSIRQYSKITGLYSSREYIMSDVVFADFEDAFLFDGKRQLKIKFNPKVSSFKNDILESKTDTIGGKYPYIFRNGYTHYKEFPISGLISYQEDNDELFMAKEDYKYTLGEKLSRATTYSRGTGIKDYLDTDLVSETINSERLFKLEVLEWLNDGNPKLFKSPTEGNYIVRLLNVNLTPIDTVGRMLHTFNCMAYEIAECKPEVLNSFGFIELDDPDISQQMFKTIKLVDLVEDGIIPETELLSEQFGLGAVPATMVEFYDMLPGTKVKVNGIDFAIGVTGTLIIDNLGSIFSIVIEEQENLDNVSYDLGSVNISYIGQGTSYFDMITSADIIDVPIQQFINRQGAPDRYGVDEDIIARYITNIKREILSYNTLRFTRRDIQYLYCINPSVMNGNNSFTSLLDKDSNPVFFKDMACIDQPITDWNQLDPWALYELRGFAQPIDMEQRIDIFAKRDVNDNIEYTEWGMPLIDEELSNLFLRNYDAILEAIKNKSLNFNLTKWKSQMRALSDKFTHEDEEGVEFDDTEALIELLSNEHTTSPDAAKEFRKLLQIEGEDFHLFEGYYKDREILYYNIEQDGVTHVVKGYKYHPYIGAYLDPHLKDNMIWLQDWQCHFYVVFNDNIEHTVADGLDGIRQFARESYPEIINGNPQQREFDYWPRTRLENPGAQHTQAEIILDYYQNTPIYWYNEQDAKFDTIPWISASEGNLVSGDYYKLSRVDYIFSDKYDNKADYYIRNDKEESYEGQYNEDTDLFYDHVGTVTYTQYCSNYYYTRQPIYASLIDSLDLYGVKECPYCGHKELLNYSNAIEITNSVQCPHCGKPWNKRSYRMNANHEYEEVPNVPIKNNNPIRIDLGVNNGPDTLYVDDTIIFEVKGLEAEDITSIRLGSGVTLDASYLLIEKTYSFEPEDLKEDYETAKAVYESIFGKEVGKNLTQEELDDWIDKHNTYVSIMNAAYKEYIKGTEEARNDYLIKHGLV